MDIDQMGGSTLQAMAEAVEGADVFLMCMSNKYKHSPACRAGKLLNVLQTIKTGYFLWQKYEAYMLLLCELWITNPTTILLFWHGALSSSDLVLALL
jgi:hypothetical protein